MLDTLQGEDLFWWVTGGITPSEKNPDEKDGKIAAQSNLGILCPEQKNLSVKRNG